MASRNVANNSRTRSSRTNKDKPRSRTRAKKHEDESDLVFLRDPNSIDFITASRFRIGEVKRDTADIKSGMAFVSILVFCVFVFLIIFGLRTKDNFDIVKANTGAINYTVDGVSAKVDRLISSVESPDKCVKTTK
jgi:hypothetical protein